MAGDCDFLVDVGCDHGYVPINLLENGKCRYAIATDIASGPLDKAIENAISRGHKDKMEFFRSDGLNVQELRDRILEISKRYKDSTLVIAGMGGKMICGILHDAKDILSSFEHIIVQPQRDLYEVRETLLDLGYAIEDEKVIYEEGKYYFLIKSKIGDMSLSYEEKLFGPVILKTKDQVFLKYLRYREEVIESILCDLEGSTSEDSSVRKSDLQKELAVIKKMVPKDEGN